MKKLFFVAVIIGVLVMVFACPWNVAKAEANDPEASNNKKYFTIIHSCGNFEDDGENKGASWVGINLQQQPQNNNDGIHYYNGFFLKTLKGPFRHWGRNINLVNNSASDSITEVQLRRIYLWY